jgi:hypothetical protein
MDWIGDCPAIDVRGEAGAAEARAATGDAVESRPPFRPPPPFRGLWLTWCALRGKRGALPATESTCFNPSVADDLNILPEDEDLVALPGRELAA